MTQDDLAKKQQILEWFANLDYKQQINLLEDDGVMDLVRRDRHGGEIVPRSQLKQALEKLPPGQKFLIITKDDSEEYTKLNDGIKNVCGGEESLNDFVKYFNSKQILLKLV
jgi:TusA-related sulfurtransferase